VFSVIDLIILVLAIGFAITGYRQGFVVSSLSFIGFLGGAALGLQLASPIATALVHGTGQVMVALVVVIGFAMLGQFGGVWLGGQLRDRLTWRPARVADSAGGAAVSAIAVLIAAWMVAAPLASAPYPALASAVRRSEVIHAVDGAVPGPVRDLYQSLRQTVRQGNFPEVFGPLSPTQVPEVPDPDPTLRTSAAVVSARPSVVKVTGVAFDCDRRIEGTGFAVTGQRIVTNAHVVAGVDEPKVEISTGRSFEATVVFYDPDVDIAVLDVPGLTLRPLGFSPRVASARDDAIVVGFPQDRDVRNLFVGPARVRTVQQIRGPNIYSTRTVSREVYAIKGQVRSGNSGGPLLAPDGSVYGVIFAAAVDDSSTGFVLTAAQVSPDVQAGIRSSQRVDTGRCD
jgi:S1-C subfamily serine protease